MSSPNKKYLRTPLSIMSVAVISFAIACDSPITDANVLEIGAYQHASNSTIVLSRTGVAVEGERMQSLMATVARQVALALADDAVRDVVFSELTSSPYRENKLHFSTLLRDAGQPLLDRMAAVREEDATNALLRLDSIVDLEFYMPVPAHRDRWDGGTDLLVATVLRDDGTLPVAYDLQGNAVRIASAQTPPETPTLVLVPVETDFSRPASSDAPSQSVPAKSSSSGDPGAYMTYSWVSQLYEGWPNGSPEFEVHAAKKNANGNWSYVACAGEQAIYDQRYNQDNNYWSDANGIFMASEAALGGFNDQDTRFEVWEDDSEPCTASQGMSPKTSEEVRDDWVAFIGSTALLVYAIYDGEAAKIVASAVGTGASGLDLVLSYLRDDDVGIVDLTPVGGCWPESGPVRFNVWNRDHSAVTAQVDLDYRLGDRRDPICPLVAYISGPSYIEIGSGSPVPTPTYSASSSGGQGDDPTYEWRLNGVLKSTAQSWTMSPVNLGNQLLQLTVERSGPPAVRNLTVHVSDDCTGCGPGGGLAPGIDTSRVGNH